MVNNNSVKIQKIVRFFEFEASLKRPMFRRGLYRDRLIYVLKVITQLLQQHSRLIDYSLTIHERVGDIPLDGISMTHLLECSTVITPILRKWQCVALSVLGSSHLITPLSVILNQWRHYVSKSMSIRWQRYKLGGRWKVTPNIISS